MSEVEKISKARFINSAIWKLMETVITKGISLIISIILARILLPDEFGIIAITSAFTTLADLLIQAGFNTALVQKKKVDNIDYSTVFLIGLGIAIVLYTTLFLVAPSVATYYEIAALRPVIRVIGIQLFIQALGSVQMAIAVREMQFRFLFISNIISSLISGCIAIVMACYDFGIWSLVVYQISQLLIVQIILFCKLPWKPARTFSAARAKELLAFSSGVIGSTLLSFLGDGIYSILIGKAYSVQDLGYSEKGSLYPRNISLYAFGSVANVLLPTLSSYQDNIGLVKGIIRKVVAVIAYAVFPMMAGLAVVAPLLVNILLTEKWMPCVPIMRWMCLYYVATPMMLSITQLFLAIGKSNVRVKTEVVRFVLLLLLLWLGVLAFKIELVELVSMRAIVECCIAGYMFYQAKRIVNYTFREVCADLALPIILTICMTLVVSMLSMIPVADVLRLFIQIVGGIVTYLGLSIVLKPEPYLEVVGILKGIISRSRRHNRHNV